MCRVRARSVWVCLFLVASFIVGCSPKSTPPGANSIYGGVDVARFSYHYWDEGLAILIWHDFAYGGEGCSGSGSTEDPVYRLKCDVESGDGRSFSWKAHTQDGVTADMWIEDQSYDLSQGSLFLVSSKDDGVQVEQLQRDLSELEPTVDTISATSYSDSDVAGFIARIRTEGDSPGVDDKDGLAALIDALQLAGQTVEIAGPVDQPFFSVPGQIIVVNGQDVQVFEYPDGAAAQAEAAQISPDASSVGTSIVSWAATPHFYAQDRVIVLYVGDDHAVVDALNDILGQPVAEGMGVPLSPPNTATLVFDALAAADYEALLRLMDETFAIGYWLSEGQTLTPAQAVEQLRLNLLPDPASVSFIRDRAQFPDLGNVDPATAFGPDVQIVDLVYSQGWGADGLGEAILTIGEGADGSQFWHGIIYTSAGFAAPPGPPDMATLLSDAFAAADYDALPALMGESFAIGYWLSEGQRLTPAQAVEQLRLNLLLDPAAVSFIRDRSQFPDLDPAGVDPATVFGPDVQIVDLVYSQGWGTDGLQEAILAIAQNPDGSQYWHGMLYGRFAELPVPPGQEPPSYESAVYRNPENGFELDYPASWHLDDQVLGSRASGALFYVEDTDEEPIFSAVVFLWDPRNDLDAWVDQRRQAWSGSRVTVLSEEELTVAGGHRAIQFELQGFDGQTTNYLFMEVGDRYLELFGTGDLEEFGEIIGTLRFGESGS
jgi:hypothetical protein